MHMGWWDRWLLHLPARPVARKLLSSLPESMAKPKMPVGVAVAGGAHASAQVGARIRSPCDLTMRMNRGNGVTTSCHLGHVVEP